MRTWTPFTPPLSSCSTHHCAAGRLPLVAAWCLPLLTKPRLLGFGAGCPDGGRGSYVRNSLLSPAISRNTNGWATPPSKCWAISLPLVERVSIDEAFADVAGCIHLFGPPPEIARAIRCRVRAELGLPISVGVARTKHLAKIASQVAKPDGLVVVDPETELDFLHPLPVELMWGVGPVTKARLAEIGIITIGQLAKTSRGALKQLLGHAIGHKLTRWRSTATHGKSRRIAEPDRPEHNRRSAGNRLNSAFFDPHCSILRTGSGPACGPNPGSAGPCRCGCGLLTSGRSRTPSP